MTIKPFFVSHSEPALTLESPWSAVLGRVSIAVILFLSTLVNCKAAMVQFAGIDQVSVPV